MKKYETPEMEIVIFDVEDVITTSSLTDGFDGDSNGEDNTKFDT